MAADAGVVQGSSYERSAARLSYARADHGKTNGTVSLGTTPGREYTDKRGTYQHIRLGTYGGRGRGSGEEAAAEQGGRPIGDPGGKHQGMARGGKERGDGGGERIRRTLGERGGG